MATRPIFVVAGRRRLVAQPDGLTLGFALHLVIFIYNYFFLLRLCAVDQADIVVIFLECVTYFTVCHIVRASYTAIRTCRFRLALTCASLVYHTEPLLNRSVTKKLK